MKKSKIRGPPYPVFAVVFPSGNETLRGILTSNPRAHLGAYVREG